MLLLPTLGLAYFVNQPETPMWVFLLLAALAGVGGGNFSSSMANISFFFPEGKRVRPSASTPRAAISASRRPS